MNSPYQIPSGLRLLQVQPCTSQPTTSFPTVHLNPELQFQKNYPKNVFIPLIQYLAQKGYKQAYEQCVGTREQIQRKNVVSLDMIFNLTRQPWFQRNINKNLLLGNISNRILMNSKIKKKLFHLRIAQYILIEDASLDIKEFKKNISKMANQIAGENLPSDQLFTYPNSIIYLLTLFLKIFRHSLQLKGIYKIDQQFQNMKIQQQAQGSAKPKQLGSKEQYKYLVKEIVQLFAKRNLSMNQLTDAFEEIKQTVLCRANQIREQYHLSDKIPNWELFVELVVTRSFESKRKDGKITNMIFNEWINEYKSKSTSVEGRGEGRGEGYETTKTAQEKKSTEGGSVKKFSPIILTKNY